MLSGGSLDHGKRSGVILLCDPVFDEHCLRDGDRGGPDRDHETVRRVLPAEGTSVNGNLEKIGRSNESPSLVGNTAIRTVFAAPPITDKSS